MTGRSWRFQIDGIDHVVEIEPNNPKTARPDGFHVDGQSFSIKIPVSFARRYEFPFQIAGHPAMLTMSAAPLSKVFWPRYKAFWSSLVRRRDLRDPLQAAAQDAGAAFEMWSYEVAVDGRPVQ